MAAATSSVPSSAPQSPAPFDHDGFRNPLHTPSSSTSILQSRSRANSQTTSHLSTATTEAPRAPVNTPLTASLAGDFQSLNLDRVDQKIEETPGSICDFPTAVPVNTPRTGSPHSTYGPRLTTMNLPRIDELIEFLPEPRHSTIRSNTTPPSSAPPSEGVREHSDWHHTIEEDLDKDLARLENLAQDDNDRDPSKPAALHFRSRLLKLLNDPKRRYDFGNIDSVTDTVTNGPRSPQPMDTSTAPVYEFHRLQRKVDDLVESIQSLTSLQVKDAEEIKALKQALGSTRPSTASTDIGNVST